MTRRSVAALAGLAALVLAAPASAAVTEKKGVVYGSAVDFDGERQELALDLYRPERRARPRPAIVWVHGGGFTFGDRIYMTPHARAFAERGYVSATITYRLADDGELAQVGFARAIEAAQHDAQAAVRWLRRHAKRAGGGPVKDLHRRPLGRRDNRTRGRRQPRGPRQQRQPGLLLTGGRRNQHRRADGRQAPDRPPRRAAAAVPRQRRRDRRLPGVADGPRERTRGRAALPPGHVPGGDHYVAYSELGPIIERSAAWLRKRW